MSELPKIKVKWWALELEKEETFDSPEQVKDLLFKSRDRAHIVAEGQVINSYEELVNMMTQDQYKNKETLNIVVFSSAISGG
jgi:hypothetical protein